MSKISTLMGFYPAEQLESLFSKFGELNAKYIVESSYLNVDFVCKTNLQEINKYYDSKSKSFGFLKRQFNEHRRKKALNLYKDALNEIKRSLDINGLEKDVVLTFLGAVKKVNPKSIPFELKEKIN